MDGDSLVSRALLTGLGLTTEQQARFFDRTPVVYTMRVASRPVVGLIRLVDDQKLRHGIVEVEDPGNGVRIFGQFRARTWDLARHLGLSEVELFGAAVINPRLKTLLTRQGFEHRAEPIPDDLDEELKEELGGTGLMDVLTRTFSIRRAHELTPCG